MLKTNPVQPSELPVSRDFYALGRHVTIEFYDCSHTTLTNINTLEALFLKAAEKSGATIINSSFHEFNPQGISGVIIIAESHFTVHTWPEHHYAAVDIFTCGDSVDFNMAISVIKDSLKSGHVIISADMKRGLIPFSKHSDNPDNIQNNQSHPASWRKEHHRNKPWAVSVTIDIFKCDTDIIGAKKTLIKFLYELSVKLGKEPRGDCLIRETGQDSTGRDFSATQHLKGSFISIHTSISNKAVCLDVFSRSFIEPRELADFAQSYLNGTSHTINLSMRD